MNGPVLTMAPAVEANAPFHRSHSSPDLLSGLTNHHHQPATSLSHHHQYSSHDHRTLSLKSLPSLPAFDVPSIDFDFGFDSDFKTSLRFETKAAPATTTVVSRPSTNEKKVVGIRTTTTTTAKQQQLAVPPAKTDKVGRKRSMIDRRRLWLPSSKSSPDVREGIISSEESGPIPRLPNGVTIGERSAEREPKAMERSKTVESLAGLARRSWMSSSRSPSPSQNKEKKDSNKPTTSASRQRTSGNGKKARFETGPSGASADPAPESRNNDNHNDAHPAGLNVAATTGSAESSSSTGRALNRASVYFTKFKQRPQSVFVKSTSSLSLSALSKNTDSDDISTAPSAQGATNISSSSDSSSTHTFLNINNNNNLSSSLLLNPRHSSQTASSSSTSDTTATASENASSQATADTGVTMPHPTSRDPLWATFRKLDADHAGFAARGVTSAKMAAVRSCLVPFLRNTDGHPSNGNRAVLAPEDVDRRATILNKWWNGLLEMLDGGGQSLAGLKVTSNLAYNATTAYNALQPVAGVDRPALLEATTMIMMRPEWRLSTSYFQPLAGRSPGEKVRARSGTVSTLGESDWNAPDNSAVTESAEHNVRTMFVTNLTTQMALVVDKMSMRHAPISLVNWSGKACAYAFFFVPGVAEVLVRLWGLRWELLVRVVDEFGLPRRSRGESEDIVALFPPNLHTLGWTSAKTIMNKLKVAARLPLLTAKIPWHGPWVSRWRGGDTDLLFIFCKYYFILAEEFMPSELPLVEKARAPAFVLLHAQLLANLDSTIHRQTAMDANPPLADAAHGTDASMSALPLPAYNNLLKGMAENRIVVLLKDMLSDSTVGVLPSVKLTFAEAFMALITGAAKRTSRYEHNAISMLCDFLEEALATYADFQNTLDNSYVTSPREELFLTFDPAPLTGSRKHVDFIDWPWWFDVMKMMLDSNNTMGEIRVLSFVYSMWDIIVAEPKRKKVLCIDWLLSEKVFDSFFNNWCPMVRAYYMRLLCWRICRDSGSANDLDMEVFMLVSQRLKTVWAHYLWLKQNAEVTGCVPASTAPSYPTPGKRFMIIRSELQTPQPGLFVGFDQFPTSFTANSEVFPVAAVANVNGAGGDTSLGGKGDPARRKWSLLGKVLSMTAGAGVGVVNNAAAAGRRNTWDDELEAVRRETAASRTRASSAPPSSGPPPPPKQTHSNAVTSSAESTSSTGSAPVFDEVQYVFRFTLTWPNHAATVAGPPRDRVLSKPRLPAPAQARVSARSAAVLVNETGNGYIDSPAIIRSDSPPPIVPGLPPATRRVSGMSQSGLVMEARNAKPLENSDAPPTTRPHRLSLSLSMGSTSSTDETSSPRVSSSREGTFDTSQPPRLELDLDRTSTESNPHSDYHASSTGSNTPEPIIRPAVQPIRPTGMYVSNSTYAGRALAEWSLVVIECNSFVDRRRDEGVLGLGDVEVPSLGVDGLGIRGFGRSV